MYMTNLCHIHDNNIYFLLKIDTGIKDLLNNLLNSIKLIERNDFYV